uniref:RNA-directed DNA polymerase n=1 Tax=Fagus sylvatica TaxID=28930 RepID=A0A2N9H363_FAGSY
MKECKAVTILRSGKAIGVKDEKGIPKAKEKSKETQVEMDESGTPKVKEAEQCPIPTPFPQALRLPKNLDVTAEILEHLHQVKVNLPLLHIIKQMPAYTKVIKDMCTVKRKHHLKKTAFFTEQMSAIIQHKPADRSVRTPKGMVEDVLIKIENFYYLVDFIILDTEPTLHPDNGIPIILGRPFLTTANTLINCRNGRMKITFGSVTAKLNIFNLMRHQLEDDECHYVNLIEYRGARRVLEEEQVMAVNEPWRPRFEELPETEKKPMPSSEEIPQLELKPLPNGFKYAYLGPGETFPVVIFAALNKEQEEDDCKTSREPQCRLNPTMKDVVKNEVIKLLDAVKNANDELIPTRLVTGWRICIDYRKLNSATRKYHFPLPFIDQILEKVAGHKYYCFLDGYSSYYQIEIALEDQGKTTFTCPFGTFAFRRMPFGLCNAPATFQRCMMSIFSDMVEKFMEVFMDDLSIFGDSFDDCLNHLKLVLARCVEKGLVLNWDKCHFMVTSGIVLGHVVSSKGIEVDKAKVDLILNLPTPKIVRDVRSFLGHASFYRRFIKDFSAIFRPLCILLLKESTFEWTESCELTFKKLVQLLTSAPIMQALDWSLPFEIMCNASDYTVVAVLGQRKDKKPHVIYYASRTLTQMNYTTTEKEMLVVVFALDKFRFYLMGTSIVVFTDHAAFRYLLSKKDAKACLIHWILLLQEFNLQTKDNKGVENMVANHLSRLTFEEVKEEIPIRDAFPDEQLFVVTETTMVCTHSELPCHGFHS